MKCSNKRFVDFLIVEIQGASLVEIMGRRRVADDILCQSLRGAQGGPNLNDTCRPPKAERRDWVGVWEGDGERYGGKGKEREQGREFSSVVAWVNLGLNSGHGGRTLGCGKGTGGSNRDPPSLRSGRGWDGSFSN